MPRGLFRCVVSLGFHTETGAIKAKRHYGVVRDKTHAVLVGEWAPDPSSLEIETAIGRPHLLESPERGGMAVAVSGTCWTNEEAQFGS